MKLSNFTNAMRSPSNKKNQSLSVKTNSKKMIKGPPKIQSQKQQRNTSAFGNVMQIYGVSNVGVKSKNGAKIMKGPSYAISASNHANVLLNKKLVYKQKKQKYAQLRNEDAFEKKKQKVNTVESKTRNNIQNPEKEFKKGVNLVSFLDNYGLNKSPDKKTAPANKQNKNSTKQRLSSPYKAQIKQQSATKGEKSNNQGQSKQQIIVNANKFTKANESKEHERHKDENLRYQIQKYGHVQRNREYKEQIQQKWNQAQSSASLQERTERQINIASECFQLAQIDLSAQLFQRILDKFNNQDTQHEDILGYIYASLGNIYILKNSKKYRQMAAKALEIYSRQPSMYFEQIITLKNNMALAQQNDKHYQQAIDLYNQVLELQNKFYSRRDERRLSTLNNLFCLYCSRNDTKHFKPIFDEVQDIIKAMDKSSAVVQLWRKNCNHFAALLKKNQK